MSTIGAAAARLSIDQPDSVYFYHHKLGLRGDLLFGFPLLAAEALARATRKTIQSHRHVVAQEVEARRWRDCSLGDFVTFVEIGLALLSRPP